MSTFDHRLLAQRHPVEVGRLRAFIARMRGEPLVLAIHVEHEADDSCCRMEPWPSTLAALIALVPSRGDADGR